MSKPTVYLAGPRQIEGCLKWREFVEVWAPEVEWINPFTIHAEGATGTEIYERDLEAIRSADVVFLHRPSEYEACGAYIEAGYAGAYSIPTVVWNEAGGELPEFLEWHADASHGDLQEAFGSVLELLEDLDNSGSIYEAEL